MMGEQVKDGGPAFPGPEQAELSRQFNGMSLRDWFAGMALQGLLASGGLFGYSGYKAENLAFYSYEQADAMLAERNKSK